MLSQDVLDELQTHALCKFTIFFLLTVIYQMNFVYVRHRTLRSSTIFVLGPRSIKAAAVLSYSYGGIHKHLLLATGLGRSIQGQGVL